MAPPSSRVRLDLNNPQFQDGFFALDAAELKQVVAALRRLRQMEWNAVYSHPGLHWEAVEHLQTPNGAKACSIRLSRKIRAIGYRDGDFLRLVSLHPDHDSAYK